MLNYTDSRYSFQESCYIWTDVVFNHVHKSAVANPLKVIK